MIAIETVDLELELAGLFGQMLSISPKIARAIFLAPKSEQTRLDMLRNAAEAALAPHPKGNPKSEGERRKSRALTRVKAILTRSQEAINRRHRAVHDEWHVEDKSNEIKRRVVNGKLTREASAVPLNELESQVHTLRVLIDDIYELAKEFREEPPRLVSMRNS